MTTLLRFAALPLADLAHAGASALFADIALLEERLGAYEQQAVELAEHIGEHLVTQAGLDRAGRGLALRVRRQLHQGALVTAGLTELAAVAMPMTPDLAAWMRSLAITAGRISAAQEELLEAVTAEERRLLGLPWQLLRSRTAGRHALATAAAVVSEDVAGRLGAGEPWTTKRMRQRSEYLWRLLLRGSTRATPRGWLAHATLVSIVDTGLWMAGGTLLIEDLAATEVTENFEQARLRRDGSTLDPGAVLSLAPLAWKAAGQVHVWQVQGEDPPRLVRVLLRQTPVMDAVWAALHPGPQRAGELVSRLAGPDVAAQDVLGQFLNYLTGIGVLQVSSPPAAVRLPWRPVSAAPGPATPGGRQMFVDVYRRPATGMATAHAKQLATDLVQALRLMALTDLDSRRPPVPVAITEAPRPLLDVVADCVNAGLDPNGQAPHRHDWPACADQSSRYGRLLRWLEGQMPDRPDGTVIDLSATTLDAFDAPEASVDWPMDFLLRPVAGDPSTIALVQDLAPAGLLDARFVPALTHFAGEPPHVTEYRAFLRSLSAAQGIPFVELLIPPLSAVAANAVRRPGYTDMWTGDPDLAGYFPSPTPQPAEHIPLSAITLRRLAGQVLAEAGGQRIWPITHSVRVPQAPWDVVRGLLLRASPQADRRQWRPLNYSLPAFGDRQFVPRLTVGNGLAVTPAQWRVSRADLPDPADTGLRQARHLHQLRTKLGLPRWVQIAADPHDEPAMADLESLATLRLLAGLPPSASSVLIAELLPGPDQLPVQDAAAISPAGHLAELLLRLPPQRLPAPAGNTAYPARC